MTRDEGSLDPVYLSGRARDLWTAGDETATELGSATLSATIELVARVVRHVEVTPAVAAMSRLAGAPAMSGFRAAADKVAPELRQARDLRYTLLDDVPVATLISGHALSASNLLGDVAKSGYYLPVADQCAGFATGGLLMTSFEAGDPVIVTGPAAPDLDHGQDPGDPGPGTKWRPCRATPCAVDGASTSMKRALGGSASMRCSATPTCAVTGWRRSSTSTPWTPSWTPRPASSSIRGPHRACCRGRNAPEPSPALRESPE